MGLLWELLHQDTSKEDTSKEDTCKEDTSNPQLRGIGMGGWG